MTRKWTPKFPRSSWVVTISGRTAMVHALSGPGHAGHIQLLIVEAYGASGPLEWHRVAHLRKATDEEIDKVMGVTQ